MINLFRKHPKIIVLPELGKFRVSGWSGNSSVSKMIDNELGNYKLVFKTYNGSVTDFQLSLYKYISGSWQRLASGISNMNGNAETMLLEKIIIRDFYDKSTNVLCEITTNQIVLEFKPDNELIKDFVKQ